MRSLRAFLISFVLSLTILGSLAFSVLNKSLEFDFSTPTLENSTVAADDTNNKKPLSSVVIPEEEKPSGADVNNDNNNNKETDKKPEKETVKEPEIKLPTGDVTSTTFLFVSTDYQPSLFNYKESGYDDNGLYIKKKEVLADALLLMKIDRSKKTFMFSSIPANAVVNQSTNKTVAKLFSEKGASYMVNCVFALTGIKVEHLMVISVEDGVKALKKIGNISYDVPCDMVQVNEAEKYEINLKAGYQELTPKQAVSMLRFTDFPSGSNMTRERLIVDFTKSLVYKLASPAYIGTAVSLFSDTIGYFETDFGVDDFKKHMDLFFSYPNYNTKTVTYPGYTTELYGEEVFIPSFSEAISSYEEYK